MKIRVTKLDAALRQLNTAITLWFRDGDEVAIHTLAAASHQIVYDIVRKKNGPDLLYDSIIFKDEYRKHAVAILKAPQNFFKHADSDPTGEIEFSADLAELFFMHTMVGLDFLCVPSDGIRSCFVHWFGIHHKEYLTEKGTQRYVTGIPMPAKRLLGSLPKADFFEAYRVAYAKRQFA